MRKFGNPRVESIFKAYPKILRGRLLSLRQLIFDVAERTPGVGKLEETLKWGEPAYVTSETKSGSTIRIDQKKSQPGHYAIYFHCQTNLVETFREIFRSEFEFEGNRAIVFHQDTKIPSKKLAQCISMSLTYRVKGG